MTKQEAKNMANDELIISLMCLTRGERFTKKDERDAVYVCEELNRRGITTADFMERCIELLRD